MVKASPNNAHINYCVSQKSNEGSCYSKKRNNMLSHKRSACKEDTETNQKASENKTGKGFVSMLILALSRA